jgi:hypothetical protein
MHPRLPRHTHTRGAHHLTSMKACELINIIQMQVAGPEFCTQVHTTL